MPKTHHINKEQVDAIISLRKTVNDKQVDKRLRAVQMRGEGAKNSEIAKILETSTDQISIWVSLFAKGGVQALLPKSRGGNRRNMSYAEEAELLAGFEKLAESGQIVEIGTIKSSYEEKVGHTIGGGQIYRVLSRHNWRKVKPRSRHPKKASSEVIETSKKLTLDFKN